MAQIRLIGTDPSQVPTNGMLGNLAFQNAESVSLEKLVVTGDVGIGTLTPASRLEIVGNASSDAKVTFSRVPVQTSNDGVIGELFFQNNTDSIALISVKRQSAADDAYIQFATQQSGGGLTERLRITSTGTLNLVGAGTAGSTQAVSFSGSAPINSLVLDSSGRVGLGIISPTAKLQVAGSLSAYNSTSNEGAMAEAFSEIISQPINLAGGASLDVGTIPVTNDNNWRAIVRGTYSNNYEGGGLTPPSFYLELNSTQNTIPCGHTSITVSRNTSTNRLKFLNNSNTSRVTFTGTIEIIVNNQSSQPVNSITTIGRVGVGTISPAELLHVAGTIRMNAVPGTNTNAALPVLFQTSAGNIDGGSSLTYNPGGDELSVNGNSISVNTFRGGGNLGVLTCANGSGQYDFRATNDSLRFIAGSSEAGRFDSGRNLLVGNNSTNIGTGFADKTNRCFIGGATGAGGGIGAYGFISSLSGTATFVVANNGALRVTIYSTADSQSARIGQYIFVGLNKNTSDPVVQSTLTNSPNWTFSYTHAGGTNTLVTVTAPASETYFQGIRIIVEPLG